LEKLQKYLNKPTVDVLLATFNGARYLEEQLDSLDRQEDVNVRVWANDDGSVDETLTILNKWEARGLIKEISKTPRVGSTRAFLSLLSVHTDSEFVAFCDQDDIWHPKKLAIQLLNIVNDKPGCVISQRLFVDSSGTVIGASKKLRKSPSFENAMIENIAPGNTILMNNQAINLINRFQGPPVKHYDSWIYLLLTYFGKVDYVDQPLVRYRIHDENNIGLRKYHLGIFLDSAENFLNQVRFLREITEIDLPQDKKPTLVDLISISDEKSKVHKVFLIFKLSIERQRRIDKVGMKMILVMLILTSRL
jgi:glycosyltransferase involved in cell wall biosynthesis